MKEEAFLTYQKFNDQAAAAELADFFSENGIEFKLEDSSINFDVTFSYNELNKEFRVKIKDSDFTKANKLLQQAVQQDIEQADESHYLYRFTNDELIDLIEKADEWNPFDVALAQDILKQRGKEIKDDTIQKFKADRLTALREPEKAKPFWIATGYLLAILGGILGFFIGWHLINHKRTLPNGESIYAYTDADRKNGYNILALGVFSLLAIVAFKVLKHS